MTSVTKPLSGLVILTGYVVAIAGSPLSHALFSFLVVNMLWNIDHTARGLIAIAVAVFGWVPAGVLGALIAKSGAHPDKKDFHFQLASVFSFLATVTGCVTINNPFDPIWY
jgi:hypothetical protein